MAETKDERYAEYPSVLREFAAYKLVIQGCSRKTVDEYMLDLRTFFRYLKVRYSSFDDETMKSTSISDIGLDFIGSVTAMDIYEFLVYADGTRKNNASSKARKLSAIKALYKYLTVKRSLLDENPAANIESPKQKKSLPKHLSIGEATDLLQNVRNDKSNVHALRDYTILTLFLNCGMRLSELVGIDINKIDPDLRSLVVIGKGNKERIIYLNDGCRAVLAEYLSLRLSEKYKKVETKALFLSNRLQRISPKTVQWLVKKHLKETGLQPKNYSTHKLRHTAATLMYQSGQVDVRTLKEILGHEQLNTTQIYTHVSDKNIESAMQKNPLNAVALGNAKKDEE